MVVLEREAKPLEVVGGEVAPVDFVLVSTCGRDGFFAENKPPNQPGVFGSVGSVFWFFDGEVKDDIIRISFGLSEDEEIKQ